MDGIFGRLYSHDPNQHQRVERERDRVATTYRAEVATYIIQDSSENKAEFPVVFQLGSSLSIA